MRGANRHASGRLWAMFGGALCSKSAFDLGGGTGEGCPQAAEILAVSLVLIGTSPAPTGLQKGTQRGLWGVWGLLCGGEGWRPSLPTPFPPCPSPKGHAICRSVGRLRKIKSGNQGAVGFIPGSYPGERSPAPNRPDHLEESFVLIRRGTGKKA